jgi:hypothetical protein
MIGPKIGSGVSILVLLLIPQSASSEKSPTYIGWTRCTKCHDGIARTWQSSRHAKAIESLKKSNQENLPACVKCHVTGYEQDGGFLDYELTPEMAGVQCEECHGPGSHHVNNPAGEPVKSKVPGAELCRKCHTAGQDPGFSFEKKSAEVHGRKQ